MSFKRFGGAIETVKLGGNIRFLWVAVALILFSLFLIEPFQSFAPLFLAFFISLTVLLVGNRNMATKKNKVRQLRFKKHIKEAQINFKEGKFDSAKESIRRAKIYEYLPINIQAIENKIEIIQKSSK